MRPILALALLAFASGVAAQSQSPSLEERMSQADFHATGLDKLSPAELHDAVPLIPAPTETITIEGAGHDLRRGRFDLASVVAAVRRAGEPTST